MSDIADWFKRLPFFTRWWLALTAGFTLLGRFGIFKAHQLVLLYEPFIKQFQVISLFVRFKFFTAVTVLLFFWVKSLCGLVGANILEKRAVSIFRAVASTNQSIRMLNPEEHHQNIVCNQHLVQYQLWNKCSFKLRCILGHFLNILSF
jgi:hypothetical protein